jgi:tRNA U55 pseudouridine synthase TruB
MGRELKGVHLVNKPVGWTPLETLKRFKSEKNGKRKILFFSFCFPSLPSLVVDRTSYAGRLDPMAGGLLLILEGKACDQQSDWQNHYKHYAWELLLGLETDTFDVMGKRGRFLQRN